MTDEACPIHLFRSLYFCAFGETVISLAPADRVADVFGGGGVAGEEGLSRYFGGSVIYRDSRDGPAFIGIWGKRRASRFRRLMREAMPIVIVQEEPGPRISIIRRIGAGTGKPPRSFHFPQR